MGKRMDINLVDMNRGKSYSYDNERKYVDEAFFLTGLNEDEYPNIYLDHKITDKEFDNALNVLITYFMQKGIEKIYVDLDMRDKSLAPPREMTLYEIEKELGYKFKIINNEK